MSGFIAELDEFRRIIDYKDGSKGLQALARQHPQHKRLHFISVDLGVNDGSMAESMSNRSQVPRNSTDSPTPNTD